MWRGSWGCEMKSERLAELAAIPPGSYEAWTPDKRAGLWAWLTKPAPRRGWLHVERDGDGASVVMWTTGKDDHNPLAGPCEAITIKPGGELVSYMESALSMWLVWGHGRGSDNDLAKAMRFANWAHERLTTRHP